MHREQLAIVGAALTVACVVPYLRDIHRGSTRPQRASWFVFAALAVVAAVSQVLTDADSGALLAGGAAVGFGAVALTSIRHGVGGFAVADRVALVLAAVGAALSIVTDQPVVALVAVVVAEIGAVGLTVRKAFDDPGSETRSTWVIDGFAGVLSVVAVPELSFVALLYPVHHTVANGAVVAAITLGRRSADQDRDEQPHHGEHAQGHRQRQGVTAGFETSVFG